MRLGKRFISILVSIAMVWNNVGTPIAEGYQNLAAQDEQSLAAEGASATPQDDSVVSQEESVPAVQEDPAQQNAGAEASVGGDASGGEDAQASAQEQTPTDAQATPDSAATSENMSTAEGSAQASGDNAAAADPSSVSGQGAGPGEDGVTPAATGQGAAGDATSSSATADSTSSDSASGDAANSAGAATDAATPEGAESVAPATPAPERTLESTLGLAEGGTYRVTVTYGEGAGVPDGASLVLREYSQTPEHYGEPGYEEQFKDRPLPTETFLSGDDLAARLNLVAKGLSVEEGLDNVYLAKLLQVDLVDAQGQLITLNAPLKVLIETNAIDIADAPAVEMGYFDPAYDAATMPPEAAVKPIAVENKTENKSREDFDRDPEHPLRTRLEMSTDHLGTLAVVCVARAKAIWEQEGERVVLQAAGSLDTTAEEWGDPGELGEGIDSLGAWWVRFAAEPAYGARAWLATSAIVGVEPRSEGTGYAAWRLSDPAGQLFDATGAASPVELEPGDVFALGWDTGAVGEGEQAAPEDEQPSTPGDAAATPEDGSTPASDPTSVDGATEPASQPAPGTTNPDGTPTTPSYETSPESQPATDSATTPSAPALPAVPTPQQLEEFVSYESKFVASDGQTYRITAGFNAPGAVPAGALLSVREIVSGTREYLDYVTAAAGELSVDHADVSFARAFDIAFVDPVTGEEYEPTSRASVRIELLSNSLSDLEPTSIVHFGDTPEVIEATKSGDAVAFEAGSFSVYVVVQVVQERVLTASDGRAYKVTVSYDTSSGIPEDAALQVMELATDDLRYDEYVRRAAELRGKEARQLDFAHAFDISLANPVTSEHYQPTKDVNVSIELMGESVAVGDGIHITHFPGTSAAGATKPADAELPEVLESVVRDGAIEFETGSFSVYIVDKDALMQRYIFLNDSDGEMTEDNRDQYIFAEQVLTDGETLVMPPMPYKPGAVFDKWINEDKTDASFPQTISLKADQIEGTDHDAKQAYLDDHPVYFEAKYEAASTVVTFYNQSGIVVERRSIERPAAGEAPATLDTNEVNYLAIQDKANTIITFQYWTEDSTGMGAKCGTGGDGILQIDSNSPDEMSLYPYLTEGHYLHFESNKETFNLDSATYIGPETVNNSDGHTDAEIAAKAQAVCAALNARDNHAIPTAKGYDFTGWYISSAEVEGAVEAAVFAPNADGTALTVNVDEYKKLLNPFGNLAKNHTLYAHWKEKATANYTVVIWKQKVTDDKNATDDEKTYDFEKSFTFSGQSNSSVTVSPNNLDIDRSHFHLNTDKSDITSVIKSDGSSVLNIFYDRDLMTFEFIYRSFVRPTSINSTTQYYDSNGVPLAYYNNSQAVRILYAKNNGYYYINDRTVIYERAGNNYTVAQKPYNYSKTYYAKDHNGSFSTFTWSQLYYANPVGYDNYHVISDRHVYFTGLYGQKLLKYGYTWPADAKWNNPSNDSIHWTYVVTSMSEFNSNIVAVGTSVNTDLLMTEYYFENVDGSVPLFSDSPNSYAYVSNGLYMSSHSFDDLFTGMTPKRYKIGNSNWVNITNIDERIQITDTTKVYFERNEYKLDFFDPSTNATIFDESVLFEAPLSNYKNLRPSDRQGQMFTGWHYDEDCNVPVDFDSDVMAAANKRVYAGWTPIKNRALVIPNGGELAAATNEPFHLEAEEKIAIADPTRDYLKVEEPGTALYNYDPVNGKYIPTEDESGDYEQSAGAYRFQGWYEAVLDNPGTKKIVEYKPGSYTYAYGEYQQVTDGTGNYDLVDGTTDTYVYNAEGTGSYNFVNAEPKKNADGSYVLGKRFDPDAAPTEPVTIIAGWQRAGGFQVRYQVKDPALTNLTDSDYRGIAAPEDDNEYIDGSHAIAEPANSAPRGYTLEYWTDKNGAHYKPNELVPVRENNATPDSSGNYMVVTLTAHYREFNPSERNMADYVFLTNVTQSGGDYVFGSEYTTYERQRIAVNEELKPPLEPPVPAGATFRGWYYDKAGTRKFDGFGVITNPLYTTLYAVYDQTFTVTYYLTKVGTGTDGKTTYERTNTVLATQTYSNPGAGSADSAYQVLDSRRITHPVDVDHYVGYWYKRGDDSTKYPYNSVSTTRVKSNLELDAHLVERSYAVFDSRGGTNVDKQEITEDGWPYLPDEPTREGYRFAGWWSKARGGDQYNFTEKLSEFFGDERMEYTLYAHWTTDGNPHGTLQVIFWAQTADRPEDDTVAAKDLKHYQMIDSIALDYQYGDYLRNDLKTTALAAYVNNGEYDIVKTTQTAYNGGSASAKAFVQDTLGYKGNNADVTDTLWNAAGRISDLQYYYVFNPSKSDEEVSVDSNDNGVLNIRFDLKTYALEFVPGGKAEISYGGVTYPADGTNNYRVPIWLNRPISSQWPVESLVDGPDAGRASFVWDDTESSFNAWKYRAYAAAVSSGRLSVSLADKEARTPINVADKFIIDAARERIGGVLQLTVGSSEETLDKVGIVHYLVREGDTTEFRELTDLRTYIKVPEKPTWANNQATGLPKTEGSYSGFKESTCQEHGSNVKHPGVKYAFTVLEPLGLSGYEQLENEHAHAGDLLNPDGGQDDNLTDGKNTSILYNLVLNRKASAQIIFDKGDPTYLGYFASHPNQYVDEEGVYNLYYYYKPIKFELTFFTDPANRFGNSRQVYCGDDLSSIIASIGEPTPPVGSTVHFKGWALSPYQRHEDAKYTGTAMPSHNLALYAIWEPYQFSVTTVGVDENGGYFEVNDEGVEIDEQGNPVPGGRKSAVYWANAGQELRELRIPNPKHEGWLFKGWIEEESGTPVTAVHRVRSHIRIKPNWDRLEERRISYDANVPPELVSLFTGQAPSPDAPVDTNSYVIGAKAIIKGGNGMFVYRKDIDGNIYRASFAYWEDKDGFRYYPNTTYVFRNGNADSLVDTDGDGVGDTLQLKAIYSEYRETVLTYDKNAIDATFKTANESWQPGMANYDTGKLNDAGNVVVYYRDMLSDAFNKATDKIPNEVFPVGQDGNGDRFTVVRTDSYGNEYVFAGWSTENSASLPLAQNGDKAYVNTIRDSDGVLRNTLFAVWGICKVVDKNGDEHVFDTIQKAVDFINTSGLINKRTGTIEMLIDYKLGEGKDVTIPAGCTVTLTTAKPLSEQASNDGVTYYYKDDSHTETAGETKHAIITRGVGGESMLFTSGSLTLKNIIFDGGGTEFAKPDGRENDPQTKAMLTAKDNGSLTLDSGAVLQNSKLGLGNYRGAAILLQDSATVTMNEGSVIKDCMAREGSAILLQAGTFTMNSDATISNCNGYKWGGAVRIKNGTANINGGVIENCAVGAKGDSDGRGGAVCLSDDKSKLNFTGGTITGCFASLFGGGIYRSKGEVRISETAQITECRAPKGGGIYSDWLLIETTEARPVICNCQAVNVTIDADGNATAADNYVDANMGGAIYASGGITINRGVISENAAHTGGGIYIAGGKTITITGGSITNNTGTVAAGGIAFGSNSSKVVFKTDSNNRALVVKGNWMGTGDSKVECNVYLNYDSNKMIESQGLSPQGNCHIGVYVPNNSVTVDGEETTLHQIHGIQGMPFGSFTGSNDGNLNCFENDHYPLLFGVSRNTDYSQNADRKIYWLSFICKITDENGNLLYKDAAMTVPAVYGRVDSNEIDKAESSVDRDDSAFARIKASDRLKLYGRGDSTNRSQYNDDLSYTGNFCVKMLVENYTTTRWILAPAGKTVTLTTATSIAANEDGYPYEGTYYFNDRGEAVGTPAVIHRGDNTTSSSMITAKGNLILEGITLDGGAVLENGTFTGLSCKQGGSIVCMQDSAKLWVKSGATLQNSFNGTGDKSEKRGGGAISNREKGTIDNEVHIEPGAVIQNCGTKGYGGAIALKFGSLNMSGGRITNCYAFIHENETKSGHGGAIHFYTANVNNPTKVYLSGGEISNCHAEAYAAGISIDIDQGKKQEQQPKLYLSGNPAFSGNTIIMTGYAGKQNGGEYAYEHDIVRQDIYYPSYQGSTPYYAPFIQVNGSLTSAAGSIWVWANTDAAESWQHYKETQQFAVLASGVDAETITGLTAFRNAQDDDATANAGSSSYLTGVMKDDDSTNVYWGIVVTGTRKVILKKLDDERKPLAGAKFRIYGASWNELKEDEVYTSGDTGVYNIDVYNFGTYYLVETVFPEGYEPTPGYTGFVEDDPATWWYYKLTVGEPGEYVDGDPTKVISPRGTYIEGPFQRNASTPTVPSTTPGSNDPGPTEPDEPASPTVAVPKVGDGAEDGHGSGYLAWKELSSVLWGGVVGIDWVTRFDKDNNEFLALRYYSDRIAVIYYGGKYYKAVDASGADAYGLLSTETGPGAWWTAFSLSMLGANETYKDSSGGNIRWIEIDGPSAISDDSTGPGTRDLEADNTKWNYRADMWLGDIFQSNRTAFEWEPFRDNTMVLTRHDNSGEDEAGIVWYEGEYYKPLGSDGSHQIVRLLGSGFTVADLTDGAAHSYERNGGASVIWFKIPNPYNQVEVDPDDNPPEIGSWLTGDDRYLFRFTAVDPAQYQWYQYRDGVIVAAHNNSNEWTRNPAVIWYDGKYYRPANDDGGAKQANLKLGNLNEGFHPSDLSDGQAHTYGMANQSVTITWEEIDVEALRPKENVVGTYTLTEVDSWGNAKRFNITVTNSTQAYSKNVTVQIPVTGTVTNVVGASWTQDNGMLSLTFNKWGNGLNAGESYIQNDVAIYGNNLIIS